MSAIRSRIGILTRPLGSGPRHILWIVVGAGVLFLAVTFALPWRSNLQARVALSSIAFMLILSVHLRPASLWNAGSTLMWRKLFGDHGTVWLKTIIGLALLIWAWLAELS